ncbi:MAG: hypothetical protein QF464_06505 [Myxococcota bacterium]|nr:hypothetical protein [Myxococcota bacterium]
MMRRLPMVRLAMAVALFTSCGGNSGQENTTTPDASPTASCDAGGGAEGPSTLTANASCAEAPEATGAPGELAASTRNRLTWKRGNTLQRDLARALGASDALKCDDIGYVIEQVQGDTPFAELEDACYVDVSQELGVTDQLELSAFSLHRSALGGNDAFDRGQYEPVASPVATTSIAIDRAVMLACIHTVDNDPTGAIAASGLPLTETTAELTDAQLDSAATLFYQRLLARDPLAAELDTVRTLAVDEGDVAIVVRDFLVLSCFVTGTTSEFLFY